jgi:hypothetical protein
VAADDLIEINLAVKRDEMQKQGQVVDIEITSVLPTGSE